MDQPRSYARIKVAVDRIAHGLRERFPVICLGEDVLTDPAGGEATFGSFLDKEQQLGLVALRHANQSIIHEQGTRADGAVAVRSARAMTLRARRTRPTPGR